MIEATLRKAWPRWGIATLAASALILAGCSSGSGTTASSASASNATSATPGSVDDGTKLTMWTRAATQGQSQAFVDLYNSEHANQIQLTIIPTDDYQTKIGAAAGSGSLPDLFASDVVYLPNYTSEGLFLDITDRINALSFVSDLAQSHIVAGTYKGREYAVPHTMDLSVLFYNKDLYKQAGLDPEAPPVTLEEFDTQARAISALGGDIHGTYFGGNCAGCLAFTWWPSIWAAGGTVMNADGTAATFDTDAAKTIFSIYRGLATDGIAAPGSKDETGATWVAPFPSGNIGIMPMPSTLLGDMPASTGVAAIPGPGGGGSTFVGGDALGISATSKNADAAWNFIAWSLGDEAQVEVLAKQGNVVARTDLASNKYSDVDPRVVEINKIAGTGQTPFAMNYGAAFNDPNGPWLALVRDQVYGDPSKLAEENGAISAVLGG